MLGENEQNIDRVEGNWEDGMRIEVRENDKWCDQDERK